MKKIAISLVILAVTVGVVLAVLRIKEQGVQETTLGWRPQYSQLLLDGATNVSTSAKMLRAYDASDAICALDFAGTPTSTVRFIGSVNEAEPNINSAQSASNQYEFLDVTDVQSASSIDGDTGITASTTADNRMVRVNLSYMNWFTVKMATSTGILVTGPVSVRCVLSNTK